MPIMGVTEPERLGVARLADGRGLGWAEWGPADGLPVVLSPGAATSRWLGLDTAAVRRAGVRLVSMDRPGLGASDPLPGRGFPEFVADVREFATARGLGRPLMVGVSQGAPFALACAAAGVVSGLAVVSGADEVAGFADGELPDGLAAMVRQVVTDPVAAEGLFAGFDAEPMWDLVMGGSPAEDLAVYREPVFAAAYRRAMDEAFAQGTGGYARDTVLAMGHWGIDLGAISVPVLLWYGELDWSHSPDQGRRLAERIPGVRHRIVPGVGGALPWTHTGEVLAGLLG